MALPRRQNWCTHAVRGAQLGGNKGGRVRALAWSDRPRRDFRIRSFRGGMREKLPCNHDTCPLFDTARFTRHIEADYEALWRAHEDGRAPAAFAVEA